MSKFLKIALVIVAIPAIGFASMFTYYFIIALKQGDGTESAVATATSTQNQEVQENQEKSFSESDQERIVVESNRENGEAVEPVKNVQSDTSKKTVELATGERLATAAERVKISQSVSDLIKILNSGTRNEIKSAVGYDAATLEEKKQFDSMTRSEFEDFIDIIASLLTDAVGALGNPNEYDTVVYEHDCVFDVTVTSRSTSFSESYNFSFKQDGDRLVMLNI